jgi:SSS family solute:Na+ symporter
VKGTGIDGDRVFPTLVTQLLPPGLRGLVIAGLLAALMSSLSSLFNSSAALFTVDIYQKLKKGASEKELVYVGKIATTVVVVCGLIWIPIMKQVAQGGGGLYDYLQNVQSFLAPAITATFLLGIFWSRINAKGAVWGLTIGFILGMGKLTIQTFYGTGKLENPAILAAIGNYNAYYACGILFLATAIVLIVVSLATKAQDPEQIKGLTFSSINKEEVRASIHPVDIVTTLIVVAMILTIYLYFSFWTVGHEPAAVQAAQDLANQAGALLN